MRIEFWGFYCLRKPILLSCFSCRYAKIHIPIIASVSEHQPTTWVSFFFDLHILICVFPFGLWTVIKNINNERVFSKSLNCFLFLCSLRELNVDFPDISLFVYMTRICKYLVNTIQSIKQLQEVVLDENFILHNMENFAMLILLYPKTLFFYSQLSSMRFLLFILPVLWFG